MKYAYRILPIDLQQITRKNYYYSIKDDFLSNHDKYKGFDPDKNDLKADRKQDHIFASYEEHSRKDFYINEDDKYYFVKDYLIPALEQSTKQYVRAILKEIRVIHNLNASVNLTYFIEKRSVIKRLSLEADEVQEFKKNGLIKPLQNTYEKILDKLNEFERIHFPKDKLHFNLNKAEALLFLDGLYKSNIISGISPRELARFAEHHITYKANNEIHRDLTRVYDSLLEYLPSQKSNESRKKISEISRNRLYDCLQKLNKYVDNIGGK